MGRIKDLYFETLVNDEDDIYADLLRNFELELPSERELKQVERVIRKTQKEDYEELIGVADDSEQVYQD